MVATRTPVGNRQPALSGQYADGGIMNWIIGSSVVLLVCGLGMLFVKNARVIRRDVNDRFRHLPARLENAATAVLRDLLDDHKQA
jgi:hypothetical protein